MLFTDLLFWSPWAGVSDLPRPIWCFIDKRLLPFLTCCCATGGCPISSAFCCPEDALSHLLSAARRMPYLICFLLPGGCPISSAFCCPEDALSHLLSAARRMPYLICFLLPGGCPISSAAVPLEDALSHLLSAATGGCPVSRAAVLPRRCHLLIFPCGAVVSDLLVLPPEDWSVLACRLLIERCRVSLPDFLPTGGCSSFFLPSADWRLPGLSTCCVVWMGAAVDLVLPATSLPRGHSRSDAVSLFMEAQSPYMPHRRKSPWSFHLLPY